MNFYFRSGWVFEEGQLAYEHGKDISENPYRWWRFSDRRDWRNGWKFQDFEYNFKSFRMSLLHINEKLPND